MNSKQLRIVLLGKSGAGKSASGNTILGRLIDPVFKAEFSYTSVTNKCTVGRPKDKDSPLVVDTPGLFHTGMKERELAKEIMAFVPKVSPGPHVLLLVLKLGAKGENEKVLEMFHKAFKGAEGHTIVLFTHKDEPNADRYLRENPIPESFADFHAFDNSVHNHDQVVGLMQKINRVVEKHGHYPNEHFQNAEQALERAMRISKQMNTENIVRRVNPILDRMAEAFKLKGFLTGLPRKANK